MAKRKKCWAVSSGDYSSYSVHAVFERREDAAAYAYALNRADAQRHHGGRIGWGRHTGSFEDCREAPCRDVHAERLGGLKHRTEAFDYYAAGVVPVIEAETTKKVAEPLLVD